MLGSHSDKFEQGGIDEAYLDISHRVKDFDEAREFAKRLMEEVLEKERLTCLIGVAPNKMVAQIASDFKKPYGLTVVKEDDVKGFLFPLKAGKIPGVGPKTQHRLNEINIETISDLASAKPEMLTRLFGAWGSRLHEFANGIDNSEVIEEYETKSIGRDITFEKDADEAEQILHVLDGLAEEVHEDVIANGLKFKTITFRVRYQHFDTHTRSKSMLFPTNDLDILKNTAKLLMATFLRGNKKVRLIGVRVSNLSFKIAVPGSA
jgi:DNA polymerase IV (DinB-like DNA polymerase)